MDFNNVLVISGVLSVGFLAFIAKVAGALKRLKKKILDTFDSSDAVSRMADITFELAFNGSLVASLLGFTSEAMQAVTSMVVFATALWFFAMMQLHHVLLKRKAWLDELAASAKAVEQRKKTAGLIRSIVRSEIARASAPDKEKWMD